MRFRPASRVVIAGASLAATLAASIRPAQADILVGSTLIPTSSVMTTSAYLPTSYVVPTSTYLPTSYVVPTSTLLPTSSVFATSYLPTSSSVTRSYYTGGLFRPRRYVERTSYFGSPTSYLSTSAYLAPTSYLTPTSYFSSSLMPTSYVVPTTSTFVPTTYLSRSYITPTSYLVDDSLVTTSATSTCCDSGSATMSVPMEQAAMPTRAVAPRVQSAPIGGGNTITSQPSNGNSVAPQAERAPSASTRQAPSEEGTSSAVNPPVISTPAPPTPTRPSVEAVSPPSPDQQLDVPIIPAPGSMGQPQADEQISRTSFRPSYTASRPTTRNILRGKVISYDSGRPEEMVAVVLTNRSGGFTDRKTLTDAEGEFKISLPDGDWAVKVTMPSDSVYTVGAVTASSGKVIDPNGKNVAEMIIKR